MLDGFVAADDFKSMNQLRYLPRAEFARVRSLAAPREDRARLFATLARINTLYMIG